MAMKTMRRCFFKKVCDFELPEPREYGVGMVFLPKSKNQVSFCINAFESTIKDQNLKILGWRDVPVEVETIFPFASVATNMPFPIPLKAVILTVPFTLEQIVVVFVPSASFT